MKKRSKTIIKRKIKIYEDALRISKEQKWEEDIKFFTRRLKEMRREYNK